MLDSMVEGEQKVASLQQEFIKADTRGKLMHLTAPVDGTVQQLAVHTVGGVVTAAQPLMLVVPQDHEIEIEAFVANKDIGFIKPGQAVQVKVETFLYTQYGTLPAKVTHVAHDAIEDKERGLIYPIRVKLKKSTINVEGKMASLRPGMSVTTEIKIGKRRVISYFLSPLLAYQKDSLHER
jgi:hemolysin D